MIHWPELIISCEKRYLICIKHDACLQSAQWRVHVMKNKRGGNFWSFEPWPKRCRMVDGQEQRVMVTATWRADHVRHEMITRRVVSDDHVIGGWSVKAMPARIGTAQLCLGLAQPELSLYIYKEACTAGSYTVSAHLSCSNARRPWEKAVATEVGLVPDVSLINDTTPVLRFFKVILIDTAMN